MNKLLIGIIALGLSACCSVQVTKTQKMACLREDLAKNWGAEFPKLPYVKVDSPLIKPDLELVIDNTLIESALQQLLNGLVINFSEAEKKLSGDYLQIYSVKSIRLNQDGFIEIDLSGSAHLEKLFAQITFVINEVSMQFIPTSLNKDGRNYISIHGTINYLDISSVPANLDRALANVGTFELTKKDSNTEIILIDITDLMERKIPHPGNKSSLNSPFTKSAILVKEGKLVLQLARY